MRFLKSHRLVLLFIVFVMLGLVVADEVTGQGRRIPLPPRRDTRGDRIGPAWLVTVGPPPVCGPRCRFRRRIRRVARIQGRWQQTFSGTHDTNPFGTEFKQVPPRDFLRRVPRDAHARPRWAGDGLIIREHFGDFSEFPIPNVKRR
jgi:hypothetical protein